MNIKEKYKTIIIIISILLLISFLLFLNQNMVPKKILYLQEKNIIDTNSQIPTEKESKILINKATLEINGIKYESNINEEISIYDFMIKLQKEGKISFKYKNYVGMGIFVEEINEIKTNNDKFWIYYVNNEKANIGISNYKINIGDVVSWKLEKI